MRQTPTNPEDATAAGLELAYCHYREQIYLYLLSKTRNPEQAEDLMQEVFLAAVKAGQRITFDDGSIAHWLYVVANRRYIDAQRRRHPLVGKRVPLEDAVDHPAEFASTQPDELRTLVNAVRALPVAQRRIFVMRVFDGKSFGEIQDELRKRGPACRAEYSRAVKAVRQALQSAGVVTLLLCLP